MKTVNRMYRAEYFTRKKSGNKICKDIPYMIDCGNVQVYSLADGVNSMQYSAEGAREIQKALGTFFVDIPSESLQRDREIKSGIIAVIREVLYNLCYNRKVPEQEFASTLMMLIVSKEEKMVRWVHIGDGIIGQQKEKRIEIVSYPRNGIMKEYTFCTTSENLERHLRTGLIPMPEKMFMMTDGAMWPCYDARCFTEEGAQVISEGIASVEKYLKAKDITDDCSMMEIQCQM